MTAPGDPEAIPEPTDEEEIILRLGDILPRVPMHLLKPGPHNPMEQVRFSVDELAEKISRGRVTVPLQRLASVCPAVFRDSSAFPGEQEIPLPLQKLLEQVGLVAPKTPGPNGIPQEQIAEARAQASRIIEAANAQGDAPGPEAPEVKAVETASEAPAETPAAPQPGGIARAFSTARQFFGFLVKTSDPSTQVAKEKAGKEEKTRSTEKESEADLNGRGPESEGLTGPEATPAAKALPPVPEGFIGLRVLSIFRLLPPEVTRSEAPPPPPDARVILPLSTIDPQLAGGHVEIPLEDFIKALPEDLRGTLNAVPETQVWIPLDEIFQSLPEDHLYYMPPLGPEPEAPAPENEEAEEGEAVTEAKEAPEVEAEGKPTETGEKPVEGPEVEPAAGELPMEEISSTEGGRVNELPPEPAERPQDAAGEDKEPQRTHRTQRISPEPPQPAAVAEGAAAAVMAEAADMGGPNEDSGPAEPVPTTGEKAAAEGESPGTESTGPVPGPVPEEEAVDREAGGSSPEAAASQAEKPAVEGELAAPERLPGPVEEAVVQEAGGSSPEAAARQAEKRAVEGELAAPASLPDAAEQSRGELKSLAPERTPGPVEDRPAAAEAREGPTVSEEKAAAEPAPSRAPWMRGFQVPPPRLVPGGMVLAEAPAETASPVEAPPPAPTPEAKRSVDFLARQPGIFAAAAFVQGAAFASADFPRKPDLDALRDFMGAFVDHARDSGQRLGWDRVVTIACEQFHATAVVRESHFIVGLHYDRVLPSLAYEALVAAADDLSKAGG